jgi:HK97 gp10 family phage protein
MPVPKSVVKINKNGVQYTSSVDRCKYLLSELTRAALRDVARLIKYKIRQEYNKLPGMKKNSYRFKGAYQHWIRKSEGNLQIGIKHDTWYGVDQELGTNGQPKRDFLRKAVIDNIDEIRKIEGQYLSSIEQENIALGLINEEEDQE